ncbi:protein of unknown function (plasmid) [Cupriavidus taiwanensis]|uniref:Uncharacterized protein n=1 Tax=Cupriavidus taiwanensis TaxID=164546 RepID=A0A375ECQ2_9BURK|nr:hypothetical protein CBM2614_U10013 [Cupriavidus taiwanensis]SOZ73294.1 hypothetical protein CBM2615_U10009 [Cupriavidus taiwanensis]SOZ75208.1 hypothetical protein CBM2613_U10110 [Cupriavidus taiwanensis]SPA03685.1 protein of unknown function [Cupriavidus taiwanensis]SPA11585.1 protein of unknown function [Cupriavidus taiwanensis]
MALGHHGSSKVIQIQPLVNAVSPHLNMRTAQSKDADTLQGFPKIEQKTALNTSNGMHACSDGAAAFATTPISIAITTPLHSTHFILDIIAPFRKVTRF